MDIPDHNICVKQNILNSLMLNFRPWSSLHTAVLANALEAGNLNINFISLNWILYALQSSRMES